MAIAAEDLGSFVRYSTLPDQRLQMPGIATALSQEFLYGMCVIFEYAAKERALTRSQPTFKTFDDLSRPKT